MASIAGLAACAGIEQPVTLSSTMSGAGARPVPERLARGRAPDVNPDRATRAARGKPEVVVYDTAMFLLTTSVDLEQIAPGGEHRVLSWSECVTPPDEDDCCWQWLSACDEGDGACSYHVVHGCYLQLDEQ